jgi:hypothetical protein
MLIRFSSVATESVTMFDSVAVPLIKMMGATGAVPAGIGAEDLPAAIGSLRQGLNELNEESERPRRGEDRDEDREPPIALVTRAVPLLAMLEKAASKKAAVMWEPLK